MPPVNEDGRHGIQGKQRFDTVGFTGTQSKSSFGTSSPRSGTPSPLHECLQFRVAAASEAANRNVGFTSKAVGGRFSESVGKACPNNAVMDLEEGSSYRMVDRRIDGLDGAEP